MSRPFGGFEEEDLRGEVWRQRNRRRLLQEDTREGTMSSPEDLDGRRVRGHAADCGACGVGGGAAPQEEEEEPRMTWRHLD